jgi:hypothetical protein
VPAILSLVHANGRAGVYDFRPVEEVSVAARSRPARSGLARPRRTVQHYYMPEADEILPYHVFVPSKWDGKSRCAGVHPARQQPGSGLLLRSRRPHHPNTADKHGYLVVAPLGYSPNGGYNYMPYGRVPARAASQAPRDAAELRTARPGARGGRGGADRL